jgi:plastocyanin
MKTIKRFSTVAYILIPVKILAICILVSCSKPSGMYPSTSASSSPSAASVPGKAPGAVTIAGMAFSPSSLTVPVNTTVTWTNSDSMAHTVTSTSGLFDSGSIGVGGNYSFTFASAGTFNYYCSIHPSMTGKIIVQ